LSHGFLFFGVLRPPLLPTAVNTCYRRRTVCDSRKIQNATSTVHWSTIHSTSNCSGDLVTFYVQCTVTVVEVVTVATLQVMVSQQLHDALTVASSSCVQYNTSRIDDWQRYCSMHETSELVTSA